MVVADSTPAGRHLVRSLEHAGVDASLAATVEAMEQAVSAAALVVLEARAMGPGGVVVPAGAGALAVAARAAGRPVWLVAGTGRTLPGALFDALAARVAPGSDELLALDAVDEVAGEDGLDCPQRAVRVGACPVATS